MVINKKINSLNIFKYVLEPGRDFLVVTAAGCTIEFLVYKII